MLEILIFVAVVLVVGALIWVTKHKNKAKGKGQTGVSPQTPAKPEPSRPANTEAAKRVTEQTASPAPAATSPSPNPTPKPIAATAAATANPIAVKTEIVKIPEDSILRRHHLAALQAQKDNISHPYPSDSVLRRHYDTLHKISLPSANTTNDNVSAQPQPEIKAAITEKPPIPEDSILKRHFLSQLRNEIEAQLPPKPSDSALKRHYEGLVQAKLQERLADNAA